MPSERFRLTARLSGGDRRSIGQADEIAARAARDPALVDALVDALAHADDVVRMRAADALEKATATRPEWLVPHKARLLALLGQSRQQELRWHLAQMLGRLRLTATERGAAASVLRTYLDDHSAIVRACALQALAELASVDPALRPEVLRLLSRFAEADSPAVRARCRKLLKGSSSYRLSSHVDDDPATDPACQDLLGKPR